MADSSHTPLQCWRSSRGGSPPDPKPKNLMDLNALMPAVPSYRDFAAPTRILIDGFPPEDVFIKAGVGKWPGRVLIGSGYRIEELQDAVAGHWGALAVVRGDPGGGAGTKHVEIVAGDLQMEMKRVCTQAMSYDPCQRSEAAAVRPQPDLEVMAVLLPKRRHQKEFSDRLGDWLVTYFRDAQTSVRLNGRGPASPLDKNDGVWMDRYLSTLALILVLREHVSRFTRYLPTPLLSRDRDQAQQPAGIAGGASALSKGGSRP